MLGSTSWTWVPIVFPASSRSPEVTGSNMVMCSSQPRQTGEYALQVEQARPEQSIGELGTNPFDRLSAVAGPGPLALRPLDHCEPACEPESLTRPNRRLAHRASADAFGGRLSGVPIPGCRMHRTSMPAMSSPRQFQSALITRPRDSETFPALPRRRCHAASLERRMTPRLTGRFLDDVGLRE